MTPAFLALEHLSWCRRQGMSWADICSSVNSIGFDEADAFDAVLVAACMVSDAPESQPVAERDRSDGPTAKGAGHEVAADAPGEDPGTAEAVIRNGEPGSTGPRPSRLHLRPVERMLRVVEGGR